MDDKLPITMADIWEGLPQQAKEALRKTLVARGKIPESASIASLALMRVIDVLVLATLLPLASSSQGGVATQGGGGGSSAGAGCVYIGPGGSGIIPVKYGGGGGGHNNRALHGKLIP